MNGKQILDKRAEIERAARHLLAMAFVQYPRGCDEDQMWAFLSRSPYGVIAFDFAWGRNEDAHAKIEEELKWSNRIKRLLGIDVKYGEATYREADAYSELQEANQKSQEGLDPDAYLAPKVGTELPSQD